MKYSIFCTLLTIFVIALSDQTMTQTATCDYITMWYTTGGLKPTNDTSYVCTLNTKAIPYNKDVTIIKGHHKAGQSDDNVKYLRILKGNKLNKFTSIFCDKFSNLEAMTINDASAEYLDTNSLSNCKNLKLIGTENNKIRTLPENLLINNPKLFKFFVINSQLTNLHENIFTNQKELEDLRLEKNQINFLPNYVFRPLVNLEILQLFNNKLKSINPKWFATLQNLKKLRLDGNQISDVPSKCFTSLINLQLLWIFSNRIKTLKSDNFDGLQNLQLLSLKANEISDFPVGIFTSLKELKAFGVENNKLTKINSNSFGVHKKLTTLYFENNEINAIDPKLIDNTAISHINMENNICDNLVSKSLNEIKLNLKSCFDNYKPSRQHPTSFNQNQKPSQPHVSAPKSKIYCGQQITGHGNIIGGNHVNRGDFPWNAALVQPNREFFCGGSLVTNQKVITAAHCFQEKGASSPKLARDITVLLGVYDLNNPFEAGRQNFPVQKIHMHPGWNPQAEAFDYDITVLVLVNEVTFSSAIQPICLPRSNTNIQAITKGFVIGYGKSEDVTKLHENIPKIIETPIHSNEDCFLKNHVLATLSSRRTFCGGTGTGTGVCNGDSGSGLIIKNGNANYLRGVVSSSLRGDRYGCDVDTYSVFTDVTKYVDWIYSIPTSRF